MRIGPDEVFGTDNPLSLRNVEDLLAERGIDICHETVRHWWNRFGPMFAAEIKKKRIGPPRSFSNWQWHLDEVFVKINGELHYLWRAVDHEGEVLEVIVSKRRDRKAALILLKRLMKKYGKTTLIDALTGFLRVDSGRCFLGPVETTTLRPEQIAHLGVARTFQDVRLVWREAVLENVMVAIQSSEERLARALSGIGARAERQRIQAKALEALRIDSVGDWYHFALPFFRSATEELRLVSFQDELPEFWFTDRGTAYEKMNLQVVGRGVKLRRIHVLRLEQPGDTATYLRSFVHYCAHQDKIGLSCRILDAGLFENLLAFDCKIFSVQDQHDVCFYARSGFGVEICTDKQIILEAIDLFDDLFAHKEAWVPEKLLDHLS